MTIQNKYTWLIGATLLGFLYISGTILWDRYAELFDQYREVSEKNADMEASPDAGVRIQSLLREKKELEQLQQKRGAQYEQSQSGVFESLLRKASEHNIHVVALTPDGPDTTSGEGSTVTFRMNLRGQYHRIGAFLNSVERGSLRIVVQSTSLSAKTPSNSVLDAEIAGKAIIVPKVDE